MTLETYLLRVIAPLIEGSSESKEDLLAQIKETIKDTPIPDHIIMQLKDAEQLLTSCFTR